MERGGGGCPLGKPLALLVYLSLAPGPVSREDLAALLWPGATRARGLQSVRQAIWLIRRTLGEDVLVGGDPVSVDSRLLEADLRRGSASCGRAGRRRLPPLAQGSFLEGLALSNVPEWDRWAGEEMDLWRRRVAAGLVRRAEEHRAAGEPGRAEKLSGGRPDRAAGGAGGGGDGHPDTPAGTGGGASRSARPSPCGSRGCGAPSPPPPPPPPATPMPGWPPGGISVDPPWRRLATPLATAALLLLVVVAGFLLPPSRGSTGSMAVESSGAVPGGGPGGDSRNPGGCRLVLQPVQRGSFPTRTGLWGPSRHRVGASRWVHLPPDGGRGPRPGGAPARRWETSGSRLPARGSWVDLHPDGRTLLHIRPDPSVSGGPAVLTLGPRGGKPPDRTLLRSPTPILLWPRGRQGERQLLAVTRGVPDSPAGAHR